jgi:hypothetical protein
LGSASGVDSSDVEELICRSAFFLLVIFLLVNGRFL